MVEPGPDWRRGVDLDEDLVAFSCGAPLLEAVYRAGSQMFIRVDPERTAGANPAKFTVVISGREPDDHAIRYDDADLSRAVGKAIADFDRLQARRTHP